VCEKSLSEVAKKISLSELVLLGRGEEITGGRKRPSVISDSFEALLAAIYLDSDMQTAKKWLLSLMEDRIFQVINGDLYRDYKTTLQEIIQKDGKSAVTYRTVSESGKEHNRKFVVQVLINGVPQNTAEGHSKKEAEQAAAKILIEKINNK
jgi:ribonuclease-3